VYEVNKKSKNKVWVQFDNTHYLKGINTAARFYVAYLGNETVAFDSVIAQVGRHPNCWREHRLVVKPLYQGMQVGSRLSDFLASYYVQSGNRFFSRTSDARLGDHRRKSPHWRPTSTNRKQINRPDGESYNGFKYDLKRVCYSFEFVGEKPRPNPIVEPKRFTVPLQKGGIVYLSKPLSLLTTKFRLKLPHVQRMAAGIQRRVKDFTLVDDDVRSLAEKMLQGLRSGTIQEVDVRTLRPDSNDTDETRFGSS
jgi:hypothetical protein